jgi:D-alanyl-D-alanine carboxypeptidase/D-alanyl-D-alanine-endopeptidase (penicillin-binding protein 4)
VRQLILLLSFQLCLLQAQSDVQAPPSVDESIDLLLHQTPALNQARVGFLFTDLDSGSVLAEKNSDELFTPASNAKLFVTALGLERLGPNYKFQTKLLIEGAWSPGQTVVSGLRLVGGGDPNLSGRVFPYQAHAPATDPLSPLRPFVDAVWAAGIREVDGNVTGVSTRYSGDLYPDGWTVDDVSYGYGAPVSALSLNDTTEQVTVRPGHPGGAAGLEISPSVGELVILNQVLTTATPGVDIQVERPLGSNEIVLSGSIGKRSPPWEQDFSVADPAHFAAAALIELLRERGIAVHGTAESDYSGTGTNATEASRVIGIRDSVPLSDAIQVINKVSQNLHAEMLLREVAFVTRGSGTLQNGTAERDLFLQQAGFAPPAGKLAIADGSGLARQDLVSAQMIVKLLKYMWSQTYRELWLASLPIGGVDGSLEHRFRHIAGAERVHAKTGSLSHVNALSGYLQTASGKWIVFSVLVNGTSAKDSEVRDFVDRLCAIFLPL